MLRPRRAKLLFDVDPFSFKDKDPGYFEVRRVEFAGEGLFVNRDFQKESS